MNKLLILNEMSYRGFGGMYLAGSEAAFRKGRIGDKQFTFRPGRFNASR
jgi:hypothetical protein